MRLCSRLTNCFNLGQTMLSQLVTDAEGASINAYFIIETFNIVIFIVSFIRSSELSCQERSVRHEHTFVLRETPLSTALHNGIRFFWILFQHREWRGPHLFFFVVESRYWASTFRWNKCGFRCLLSIEKLFDHEGYSKNPIPTSITIFASAQ